MQKFMNTTFMRSRERDITHALFMLPNLILYTVFSVFPIFVGIYYSFTNWTGIHREFKFTGLANYLKMFSDSRFRRAITFNLNYVILLTISIILLSIILGLLLNQNIKARSFFRSAYFFPSVIGMISAGLIFNQLFGNALTAAGEFLNIELLKGNILASPSLAIFGVLFVNVWQGVAIPTVLVLAGLQTIPDELLESAWMDGASRIRIFRHITIPFLLPTISMILVIVLKEGLMVYDYVLTLTSGGPAGRTESITMLIMKEGFFEQKFSYAISQAIFISLVIIGFSLIQIEAVNKKKVY